jgi:hypothetical protein
MNYQHTKEIFADGYWLMLYSIDPSMRTFRKGQEEVVVYDDRDIPFTELTLCGVKINGYHICK